MGIELFSVPVGEKVLVYAPLHDLVALVNPQAAGQIRAALETGTSPAASMVRAIVDKLRAPGAPTPQTRTGPLNNPFFLGLIPTRGCNLGCRYCDFLAPKKGSLVMPLSLAREAIDAYFKLLCSTGNRAGEVHFFGGEPFFAAEVVDFAVNYAIHTAAQVGLRVRFEATSNGFYRETRCRWIAEHFDTVVLSLDGPADIQDSMRPTSNGHRTSETIARSAKILSEGTCELILRACVTQETVTRMAETANWFAQEFRPSTVCFETLSASPLSQSAGLAPPDPLDFAVNFLQAARVLQAGGIEVTNSTGGLHGPRTSCCPVGKDALIVSPDGSLDACYLLPQYWNRNGLDMRLGRVDGCGFEIDPLALQRARSLTVGEKRLCSDCLCRYSCAGGCHVRHPATMPPGNYDALCVRTRIITIARLLERLGTSPELDAWLADRDAMEESAWQANDRLLGEGRSL